MKGRYLNANQDLRLCGSFRRLGILRCSTCSSSAVIGHSWSHVRHNHVNVTDSPWIVVSGTTLPMVAQDRTLRRNPEPNGVWGHGRPEGYFRGRLPVWGFCWCFLTDE